MLWGVLSGVVLPTCSIEMYDVYHDLYIIEVPYIKSMWWYVYNIQVLHNHAASARPTRALP